MSQLASPQIISLFQQLNPNGDNSFQEKGIFWLTVPAGQIVAQPFFRSQYIGILPSDLALLRTGAVKEVLFTTGWYPQGTSQAFVDNDLLSNSNSAVGFLA